jgi:hypothetical protein
MPQADLVLDLLRPLLRKAAPSIVPEAPPATVAAPEQNAPRFDHPARLFFQPLAPFLDDGQPGGAGLIERASLPALWTWLGRDFLPLEMHLFSEAVTAAAAKGDEQGAQRLARDHQDMVVRAFDQAEADTPEPARRRLRGFIGPARAADDMATMVRVLRCRDALAAVAAELPSDIPDLSGEDLDRMVAVARGAAQRGPEFLTALLTLVMRRLATPWQLIRLAIRDTETDRAVAVMRSPLAASVTTVLAQLRVGFGRLRVTLFRQAYTDAAGTLKDLHDTMRALRTELDLGDSGWGREIAALRVDASEGLTKAIEHSPGRMRRLLRVETSQKGIRTAVLHAADVDELAGLITLVNACRHYAPELAINQIAPHIHKELQNCCEISAAGLIDALRLAGPDRAALRRSQMAAAVRFAALLFGAEYANLLAKAAAVAGQDAPAPV